MVLTSFTCKEKCPSLILCVGAVVRFFLLLTAFLEARFFKTLLIEKAQSTVVFEVKVFQWNDCVCGWRRLHFRQSMVRSRVRL